VFVFVYFRHALDFAMFKCKDSNEQFLSIYYCLSNIFVVWSFCVKLRHITIREVSYEHLPKIVRYDWSPEFWLSINEKNSKIASLFLTHVEDKITSSCSIFMVLFNFYWYALQCTIHKICNQFKHNFMILWQMIYLV